MAAITLFISIVNSQKYFVSMTTMDRATAASQCELATILTVTDQQEAINACPGTCWIGLTGSDCDSVVNRICQTWSWDDGTNVTLSYGFSADGRPVSKSAPLPCTLPCNLKPRDSGNLQQPWFVLEPSPGDECIRLNIDLDPNGFSESIARSSGCHPSSGNEPIECRLQKWEDISCNGSVYALCNEEIPEFEVCSYDMLSMTGSGDWTSSGDVEMPIRTNTERCMYYATADQVGGMGSLLLDPSCWCLCALNPASNPTEDSSITNLDGCSTEGFQRCQLQFSIDPFNATGGGCVVEYTINGVDWIPLGSYDSSTSETQFVDIPTGDADNNPDFGIRFRTDFANDSEGGELCCYINDFHLRCDSTANPTFNPTFDPTISPTISPTDRLSIKYLMRNQVSDEESSEKVSVSGSSERVFFADKEPLEINSNNDREYNAVRVKNEEIILEMDIDTKNSLIIIGMFIVVFIAWMLYCKYYGSEEIQGQMHVTA